MRVLLFSLIAMACQENPTANNGDPTPADTAPAVSSFSLSLPDAVDTTHTELADRCAIEMPEAFECDNANPEIRWVRSPDATDSFVLIFDDPDANNYPHWAVWGIPGDVSSISTGVSGQSARSNLPEGAQELGNGFGWAGYLGSCPPSPHVYRWRLWAVDDSFDFTPPTGGDSRDAFTALEAAAAQAELDLAEACHTYGPAVSPP
jgi:Raf kinase inhibitor-like YbhB/YbcL family protein